MSTETGVGTKPKKEWHSGKRDKEHSKKGDAPSNQLEHSEKGSRNDNDGPSDDNMSESSALSKVYQLNQLHH